jgi:hypothetical protein
MALVASGEVLNHMRRKNPDARSMLERMMECSELRMAEVARFGQGYPQQVASRVLASAHVFQQWENAHSQAMRHIAVEQRPRDQLVALKRMALSMIHRKAPFEYLRDHHICGAARHRYFDVLYGPHDFARAMVREHQNYLVAGCSYLCVDTLCAPSTMDLIADYEKAYTSYWQAHTATLLDATRSTAHWRNAALMQCLDEDLRTARDSLLGAPPSRADQLTLEELRQPSDTVRLGVLATHAENSLTGSRPSQSTDARQ